ncbi:C-C motif chemokine 20b isoform X2 [Megalops cyprinoides]|uniref:C-C motif chemokine 20b isoform X2 n=1 Tax=Megalops cyprinoides TaxID=118141 RepID=UPI001864A978|nr:C-C motif chemokine 20b isoform X2 [Megalops cyprinoides]
MANIRLGAVALLALLTLGFFLEQADAGCCLSYVKKPFPCHRMKGYTIQDSKTTCDMDAIIFHTKGGKFICADPSKEWTSRRINCLKERAQSIA